MKLRKLAALSLAAAMAAGTLAGCSSKPSGTAQSPAGEASEGTRSGEPVSADGKGQIYYLNFKPEVADVWVELAEKYTAETGIPMKVQTAAAGTYEQTLKSEVAKKEPVSYTHLNNENPPAIYSILPVTTLGKISEIKNNTIPIPTINRFDTCFSSTTPSTTFLIGKRLARRTGIQALITETTTATPKESSTAAFVITTGISIPCDSVLPIPRRINFRTTIPRGIPAMPPIQPYNALSSIKMRVTVFCVAPMLRNVPIMGKRSNVMTL